MAADRRRARQPRTRTCPRGRRETSPSPWCTAPPTSTGWSTRCEQLDAGDHLFFTDWRGDPDERLRAGRADGRGAVHRGGQARRAASAGWCGARTRSACRSPRRRTARWTARSSTAGGEVILDQRVRRGGQPPPEVRRPPARRGPVAGRRLRRRHRPVPQPPRRRRARRRPAAAADGRSRTGRDAAVARRAADAARAGGGRARHRVPGAVGRPEQPRHRPPDRLDPRQAAPRAAARGDPLPPQLPAPPECGPHRGADPAHLSGDPAAVRLRARRRAVGRPGLHQGDHAGPPAGLPGGPVHVVHGRGPAVRRGAARRTRSCTWWSWCRGSPTRTARSPQRPQYVGRWQAIEMCRRAGADRVHVFDVENHAGTPVYVHAKVCVVDDVWASVGSDNFNRRSWTHDSELSSAVLDTTRDPREPRDPAGDGRRRARLRPGPAAAAGARAPRPGRRTAARTTTCSTPTASSRPSPRARRRSTPGTTAAAGGPGRPAGCARTARSGSRGPPGCGRRRSTAARRPRRPPPEAAPQARLVNPLTDRRVLTGLPDTFLRATLCSAPHCGQSTIGNPPSSPRRTPCSAPHCGQSTDRSPDTSLPTLGRRTARWRTSLPCPRIRPARRPAADPPAGGPVAAGARRSRSGYRRAPSPPPRAATGAGRARVSPSPRRRWASGSRCSTRTASAVDGMAAEQRARPVGPSVPCPPGHPVRRRGLVARSGALFAAGPLVHLRPRPGTPRRSAGPSRHAGRPPAPAAGGLPGRARAARRQAARRRSTRNWSAVEARGRQPAEPFVCTCPPECDELDDRSGPPVHAAACPCRCDIA